MAERRMFSQKIVDSDPFLDMPLSAQALYFHLNMRADDDGFLNNSKRIQRTVGASEDDLKLLIAKRYILCFDNGVVVIKHWRMHNSIRKDRHNPTQYQEEFATLTIKKGSGAYTERKPIVDTLATAWQPDGNQAATQVSIGKDSIGKDRVVVVEGNDNQTDDYNDTDSKLEYFKGKVMLTDAQVTDLLEKMGLDAFNEYIERLDEYIRRKSAKVKNHHDTILKWYNEDKQ